VHIVSGRNFVSQIGAGVGTGGAGVGTGGAGVGGGGAGSAEVGPPCPRAGAALFPLIAFGFQVQYSPIASSLPQHFPSAKVKDAHNFPSCKFGVSLHA